MHTVSLKFRVFLKKYDFHCSVSIENTDENDVYFGCDGEYHIKMIPKVSCTSNGLGCPELHSWEETRKNDIENDKISGKTDCFNREPDVARDVFPAPQCGPNTKPKSCDREEEFWKLSKNNVGCLIADTNEMLHVSPKCNDNLRKFNFESSKDRFMDKFGNSWTRVEGEYDYDWQSKFARPSKPECVVINMKRIKRRDNSTIPFDYKEETPKCNFIN